MICISTALPLKLQSENTETYVHFVFIYKRPCRIYLLADFQELKFYI